jgi:hypothetical protein
VLAAKNITTLALEVPTACLMAGDPVIGAWTTASMGDGKKFAQVSRLGHPLVNEVVIGLKDKDYFNASEPIRDAQFADDVTHPTLPALIQALFGVPAPPVPRNDLVQVFLTGMPGLNQPASVTPAEMLRLNTSIPPVPPAAQNPLGVLGADLAGFPNGRRPGDDVVDIELRAAEGILLASNPAAFPAVTDGAFTSATVAYAPDGSLTNNPASRLFRDAFPYLQTPLSGSPAPTREGGDMTGRLVAATLGTIAILTSAPAAHDMWIEPTAFAPGVGAVVGVKRRVGENFIGDPVPRDPSRATDAVARGRRGERAAFTWTIERL